MRTAGTKKPRQRRPAAGGGKTNKDEKGTHPCVPFYHMVDSILTYMMGAASLLRVAAELTFREPHGKPGIDYRQPFPDSFGLNQEFFPVKHVQRTPDATRATRSVARSAS